MNNCIKKHLDKIDIKEIGKGEEGIIFKACKNKICIAVKVTKEKQNTNVIENTMKLNSSEYFPKTYSFFECDNNFYMSMELFTGDGFKFLKLYPHLFEFMVSQVFKGLNELAKFGFSHGDFHPGNILYKENKNSFKFVITDISFRPYTWLNFKKDLNTFVNNCWDFDVDYNFLEYIKTHPKKFLDISKKN